MSNSVRYSNGGSEAFEAKLGRILKELGERIAEAYGPNCVAVVLGGGYGRGEGAAVLHNGQESAYNDFDLFVVVRKPMDIPPEVHAVTAEYEKQLGIEVDIGKPLVEANLSKLPHSLMWQDLLDGHKVLWGDERILTAGMKASMQDPLPQSEALRLLLNRGAGLLQAIMEAHNPSGKEDEDFVRRNYQKCALALGDAALIAFGLYRSPLSYRRSRVQDLEQLPSPLIVGLYQRAADFKVAPDASHPVPTNEQLMQMAQLWVSVLLMVETKRTGRTWESAESYERARFLREPEQHRLALIPRNVVKQAKLGNLSYRYPRESLYGRLSSLLAEISPESEVWQQQAEAFLRVWRTCN